MITSCCSGIDNYRILSLFRWSLLYSVISVSDIDVLLNMYATVRIICSFVLIFEKRILLAWNDRSVSYNCHLYMIICLIFDMIIIIWFCFDESYQQYVFQTIKPLFCCFMHLSFILWTMSFKTMLCENCVQIYLSTIVIRYSRLQMVKWRYGSCGIFSVKWLHLLFSW